MRTKKINDDCYEVHLTERESLLASSMIGSSFSGGQHWRVAPESYESKFGITYDRANELFEMTRAQRGKHENQTIRLNRGDGQAIRRIVEHMMHKWDDADFRTIINADKAEAKEFRDELEKQGF
jgi:hypothetical protein